MYRKIRGREEGRGTDCVCFAVDLFSKKKGILFLPISPQQQKIKKEGYAVLRPEAAAAAVAAAAAANHFLLGLERARKRHVIGS